MSAPLPSVRRYSVRHIETTVWELIVNTTSEAEAQEMADAEYQADSFESFDCIFGETDIEVICLDKAEISR